MAGHPGYFNTHCLLLVAKVLLKILPNRLRLKNAKGLKNKFLYLIKSPGWSPESVEHTAATVRDNFLKENPVLGITSKDWVFKKWGIKNFKILG